MKKYTIFLCFLVIIGMLTACSRNLTSKEDIIKIFDKNKEPIVEAIQSNKVEQLKNISGIQDVYVYDDYIDFFVSVWVLGLPHIIMVFSILWMTT